MCKQMPYTVTFTPLPLPSTLFAVHYEITQQATHQKQPSYEL